MFPTYGLGEHCSTQSRWIAVPENIDIAVDISLLHFVYKLRYRYVRFGGISHFRFDCASFILVPLDSMTPKHAGNCWNFFLFPLVAEISNGVELLTTYPIALRFFICKIRKMCKEKILFKLYRGRNNPPLVVRGLIMEVNKC